MKNSVWHRYLALGDLMTSGFCPLLHTILDGHARLHGAHLEFSTLASHDSSIGELVDEQVPMAVRLQADLVSVSAGTRDLIRPEADVDALTGALDRGVRALTASGVHVLLAGCIDPQFGFFPAPVRTRTAAFNANVWSIARDNGCTVLDLWSMRELQHPALWTADHAQLSDRGHRLVAARAAHALHVPYAEVQQHGAVQIGSHQ
ncbi:MAG TPA: SGNH/GDSL hydrolase family protein [Microbacteriaceae bacterium]|nr:SGNH/GDSL hydrolase family protein [Microbacteriaceae bacterium]